MSNEQTLTQYDDWLRDDSPFAALVMRERLVPIEGVDAVIFPPTYARPEGWREEWLGYNIDRFEDGTKICQIDSVGSQANRMEPIFKRSEYAQLVPKITIRVGQTTVNLLDAGHRAADAVVRFSSLRSEFDTAFRAVRNEGNAEPLAKLAPTSIVFGSWDSRSTHAKFPRVVRSVIRAYKVEPVHRSAQYIPPIDYVGDQVLDAPEGKQQQDAMSELGFSHAPAAWTHGGVTVLGDMRRDASLNLVALRTLGAGRQNVQPAADATDSMLKLRRYILGLALVSLTAPQDSFLREGCQLVPDTNQPAGWSVVKHDGVRSERKITHGDALAFAIAAASAFGVGANKKGKFDASLAKAELGQTSEARKTARRRSRAGGATQGEAQ